jgi:hypothetical protein
MFRLERPWCRSLNGGCYENVRAELRLSAGFSSAVRGAALDELRRAAELEPERARYGYVFAVGLTQMDRLDPSQRTRPSSMGKEGCLIEFITNCGEEGWAKWATRPTILMRR